jgi:protein O-GlcNAc transferase
MSETIDTSLFRLQFEQALQAWQNQDLNQARAILDNLYLRYSEQPDLLHLLGIVLYGQGELLHAEKHLAKACLLCPDYDDYFFNWGNVCLGLDAWPKALTAFRRATVLNPALTEAWVKLAQVCERLEQWSEAETIWRLLLQRLPDTPDLGLSLARNLCQQQRFLDAQPLYQALLQVSPIPVSILQEAGLFFFNLRDFETALECLSQAQPHLPASAQNQNQLASVYFQLKDYTQAQDWITRALALDPDLAATWWNQAQVFLELNQIDSASHALRECLQRDKAYLSLLLPLAQEYLDRYQDQAAQTILTIQTEFSVGSSPTAESALAFYQTGLAAQRNNQTAMALNFFNRALAAEPEQLLYDLGQALCLPVIYNDLPHLQACRARLERELPLCLERIQSQPQKFKLSPPFTQIPLLFHLAYQGLNDLEIHALMGDFWQNHFEQAGFLLNPDISMRPSGPLRVGFVSSFFYAHAVSHIYLPLIQSLSKDPDISVTCFALNRKADEITQVLQQSVKHFISLAEQDYFAQARSIAEAKLDILIYTDIGMESSSYLLGLQRLAPIQCVLGGHPVTTGLPQIDWVLSAFQNEPPDAQNHYREKLHLRNSNLTWSYQSPVLAANSPSKAALGFPANRRIYLCPMTLYKLHPEFDAALAAILRQDSQAEIYFFKYHQGTLHTDLLKRFEQSLGSTFCQRVHFLPWVSRSEFTQILAAADICLDPFHFSAGNTTYLCLHTGTPLLTWPSGFKRGRVAAGILQQVGWQDCIVEQQTDYALRAVQIAQSPELRRDLNLRRQTSLAQIDPAIRDNHALISFLKSLVDF